MENFPKEALFGRIECQFIVKLRIPCHQVPVVDVHGAATVQIDGAHGTEAAHSHFTLAVCADDEKTAGVA